MTRRCSMLGLLFCTLAACSDNSSDVVPGKTESDAGPSTDASSPDGFSGDPDREDGGPTGDAAASELRERLRVTFDDGTYAPLVRTFGPNDNAATANPAFTVNVVDQRAHYVAPAAAPGPRLTGFLDLPATLVPIAGEMSFEWTFPVASELRALAPTGAAIAGCYVRGAINSWSGGTFGDYWFGFVSNGASRTSAIRQGQTSLVSEVFPDSASRVTYRLEKAGRALRLYASYDGAPMHRVGAADVVLTLNDGGSEAVEITHVRVLDTSGAAVDVTADDFVWRW